MQQDPTLVAFCQSGHHAYILPSGKSYKPPRLFLLWGDYGTTYGIFTAQEQKKSPVFAWAGHLVNASGLGRLWMAVIHGKCSRSCGCPRSVLTWYFPGCCMWNLPHLSSWVGTDHPPQISVHVHILPWTKENRILKYWHFEGEYLVMGVINF